MKATSRKSDTSKGATIAALRGRYPALAVLSVKKKAVVASLRWALEFCGYDYDDILGQKTRRRVYADLRSIIFSIYQEATLVSYHQVSIDLGWNRGTVFSAINRAYELRKFDHNFSDLYDSIRSAFEIAMQREELDNSNIS